MLRMIDCRCIACGAIEEHCLRVGEMLPNHCGSTMEKVWLSAPGINYKPHYSHGLGRKVKSFREEELALEKKGQWLATKNEANSTYGTDVFTDDMTIKPRTDKQLRKHLEKSVEILKDTRGLKSTGSGFEFTK